MKININIPWNGLGDNLFHTHLPYLAKQNGYSSVIINITEKVYKSDINKLVWKTNPFVTDIKIYNQGAYYKETFLNSNILHKISYFYNLECPFDVEPYVNFNKIDSFYENKTVFDPNYISASGIVSQDKICKYISSYDNIVFMNNLNFRYIYKTNNYSIKPLNLEEYFTIVNSCKYFISAVSGGCSLRAAFGKRGSALYGIGQNPLHRHSNLIKYIDVTPKYINNNFFYYLYKIFNKFNI